MTAALIDLAYDPNNIKPGWVAFVVVMALCVATFFLWRSMNTQLRRIKLPKDQTNGRTPGGPTPSSPSAPSEQVTDDDNERPADPS